MLRLGWILLLFFPVMSLAHSQWYDIEVLAFAYEEADAGHEQFTPLVGFPSLTSAALVLPSKAYAESGYRSFIALKASEQDFNDSRQNLAYAPDTRVLFHKSWRQNVHSDAHNLPIRLYGGRKVQTSEMRPQPIYQLNKPKLSIYNAQMLPDYLISPYPWELEGTINLKLSRYMHMDTDFVFQDGGKVYRSVASAKLRSREAHYIDHPAFGLLVRINRSPSQA